MEQERFNQLAQTYRYVPLELPLRVDLDSALSLFMKLTGGEPGFLLESVEGGTSLGRYSFVGAKPMAYFKVENNISEDQPLEKLNQWMKEMQVAPDEKGGRYSGGAVGYIGYPVSAHYEKIAQRKIMDESHPLIYMMLCQANLIIDNLRGTATLLWLADTSQPKAYETGMENLNSYKKKLSMSLASNTYEGKKSLDNRKPSELKSSFPKPDFLSSVEKIKEYIAAGDVFQVVLSQRFSASYYGDPLNVYRILRSINPSPYMFYLRFPDMCIAGASPEALIRLEGDYVETNPIAGTRPRGKSKEEEERLDHEILNDEKERAEHLMLVDLARNDIGKICAAGTVQVSRWMEIENYSHVKHLVSRVDGKIRSGCTWVDALKSAMPAGTLSGAPKIRAMEIIDELEPVCRGPYGGAVGYISFTGNMDTCITIRTLVFGDEKVSIQVGAGIVADSIPESEYQETINKAKAMFEALSQAEREDIDDPDDRQL